MKIIEKEHHLNNTIGNCLFLFLCPFLLMESFKLCFTEHLPYVRHFIKKLPLFIKQLWYNFTGKVLRQSL